MEFERKNNALKNENCTINNVQKNAKFKLLTVLVSILLYFILSSIMCFYSYNTIKKDEIVSFQSLAIGENVNYTDDNGTEWEYSLDANNKATLLRYRPSDYMTATTLILPATVPDATDPSVRYIIDAYGGSSTSYNIFANWNGYNVTTVQFENGSQPRAMNNNVFMNFEKLVDITLPNTLTSLGSAMFSGCSALKEINIPNVITEIPESAFSNCSSLKNISIPNGVTIIGRGAFENCTSAFPIGLPAANEGYGWFSYTGIVEQITSDTSWMEFLLLSYEEIAKRTLSYERNNNEITITGIDTSEYADFLSVFVPSTIEGYPVVSIGENAFSSGGAKNKNLRSNLRD